MLHLIFLVFCVWLLWVLFCAMGEFILKALFVCACFVGGLIVLTVVGGALTYLFS